jgi:predicted PurR-regulated permease PerM
MRDYEQYVIILLVAIFLLLVFAVAVFYKAYRKVERTIKDIPSEETQSKLKSLGHGILRAFGLSE